MKKFITFLSLFLGLSLCQSLFCANQEFLDFNREDCDFDLDLSPENPINQQNQDPLTTLENLLQDTSRDTDIDTAPEQQEENYLSLTQEEQEFILAQIASEAPQEAQEPHLSTLETIEPSASIPASESQAPTFTPKRPRIASKPLMSTLKPATPQEISSEEEEEATATATTERMLLDDETIDYHIASRQISTKKKIYQCHLCNYTSPEKAKVTRHMFRHTGEKPFKCPLCYKGMTTQQQLDRHITRKHPNTAPYKCDLCNFISNKATELKKHKKTEHPDTTATMETAEA